MSPPVRQDPPLSAIPHPRFPWEGACRVRTKPGLHQWQALPPQQPDLRLKLPPEHSSSYLVMIKILKIVRYSEKCALSLQKTGCSFLLRIWPGLWEDRYWVAPNSGFIWGAGVRHELKLLGFTAIRFELRVGTSSLVFSLAQLFMHFLPRVSKKSNQFQVHLHRHYE